MNCSFCAATVPAKSESAAAAAARLRFIAVLLVRSCSEKRNGSIPPLMGERPQAQLLLGDLPQAREPVWLDDQEEDDEAAEDDRLAVGNHGMRHLDAERAFQPLRREIEEDREERDEGGAEERAKDRADAADDDHEEHAEREVERERLGLDRAEIAIGVERARHTAVERADGESEQLGLHHRNAD